MSARPRLQLSNLFLNGDNRSINVRWNVWRHSSVSLVSLFIISSCHKGNRGCSRTLTLYLFYFFFASMISAPPCSSQIHQPVSWSTRAHVSARDPRGRVTSAITIIEWATHKLKCDRKNNRSFFTHNCISGLLIRCGDETFPCCACAPPSPGKHNLGARSLHLMFRRTPPPGTLTRIYLQRSQECGSWDSQPCAAPLPWKTAERGRRGSFKRASLKHCGELCDGSQRIRCWHYLRSPDKGALAHASGFFTITWYVSQITSSVTSPRLNVWPWSPRESIEEQT